MVNAICIATQNTPLNRFTCLKPKTQLNTLILALICFRRQDCDEQRKNDTVTRQETKHFSLSKIWTPKGAIHVRTWFFEKLSHPQCTAPARGENAHVSNPAKTMQQKRSELNGSFQIDSLPKCVAKYSYRRAGDTIKNCVAFERLD